MSLTMAPPGVDLDHRGRPHRRCNYPLSRPSWSGVVAPLNKAAMRKGNSMSTNRIEGAGKEATGAIKQAAGKLVGNEKLQVEGAVEKAVGKAQNAVGKAQDEIAKELKK